MKLSKTMKLKSRLISTLLGTSVLAVLLALLMPSLAAAQAPPSYVSPLRDKCVTEMAKDSQIRNEILVECKQQYTADYHEQDVRQALQNNKHVVAAYAVIWGVLALLMAAMWMRQRKLTGEIARLEAELTKAIQE